MDIINTLAEIIKETAIIIVALSPVILVAYKKIGPMLAKLKTQNNIINKAHNDILIKQELEKILEKVYACGSSIFLFHNGKKGVDTTGWYYMDCKYETVREDICHIIHTLQDIPCSNNPDLVQMIMKKKIIEIVDTEDTEFKNNKQLYQYFKCRNIKAVICMPLIKKGEVIGYLETYYTINSDIYKETDINKKIKFKEDIAFKICESLGIIKNLL